MTNEDLQDFSRLLQHNANLFRLSALPGTWPEWMTPQKRREMAANFEQYAIEVEAILRAGGVSPSRGQGALK
jgi:hypothetical protein